MGWILLLLLLVVGAPAWAAKITCPGGIFAQGQTVQGASANFFHDAAKRAIGMQAHINAGTATVRFEICCRSIFGPTGCDEADEWVPLNGGTFGLDFVAGPQSSVVGPTDPTCLYQSFVANGTCVGCNVDTTVECTID